MKEIDEKLSKLIQIINEDGEDEWDIGNISMYAQGIKSKLFQILYSLKKINELTQENVDDIYELKEMEFTIYDKLYFYTDSFWINIYSLLEIVAQLVNLLYSLEFEEDDVSYLNILNHLEDREEFNDAFNILNNIRENDNYKNVKEYRNCSIHRRNIAINDIKQRVRGVDYTGSIPMTVYLIEDDPNSITPTFEEARELPEYLIDTKEIILNEIGDLLNQINTELNQNED